MLKKSLDQHKLFYFEKSRHKIRKRGGGEEQERGE
jgi:hypothetical protein